ncbi:hypothetical protein BCR35DRAFT_330082 [Leucosporidium creatinivorum]|uniref:Uncharacterized protein n=1 Tax=Leucosporidium creatinivorum TaxID=106004 RepID=A0A1Y2FVZ9_9BASI|nr:hypothetical protein BCR35DRAFT_330082 [Leucosporidium creatinivorum]
MSSEASDICLYILACVFPPAAVGAVTGCSGQLVLNILLSLLWFPGVIHACIIVSHKSRKQRKLQQAAYPPPPTHMPGYQINQPNPGYGGQYAPQKV